MAKNSVIKFLISHKNQLFVIALVLCAFLIGLVIPSPFFKKKPSFDDFVGDEIIVKDTANMILPDGSVYEGSINARTNVFHGYGVLVKGTSTYEGNWKNGELPYGRRTTSQSIYEGRFDKDLSNCGFGIINYTPEYVAGKRKQGRPDSEITVAYIGNWKNNIKTGIGRATKADASMEFGIYKEGMLQREPGANYRVGDKVYGIDVSRHQHDIDWDKLALYCDESGKVFSGKPSGTKYMQPVFFAYMKATEGATVKDRTFDIRVIEAERHGITKGAYHFLRLGSSIDEQIKNFTETVNWAPGDLPPALDVEVESEIKTHGVAKLLDMTYTWLEEVERKMGVRPVIYTRESIRDKYLKKDARFGNYQCWIARYHPKGPVNTEWQLWQMTEKGRVNGYDGAIDINLFKDDYASFQNYLKGLSQTAITTKRH